MRVLQWWHICLLACAASYLLGRGVTAGAAIVSPVLQPDTRPAAVTVALAGIRDGHVYGEIHGEVRMVVGNEIVTQTGSFRVPAGPLLVHEVSVIVPGWARYAASSRGQKYYPVGSASAERLSPQNRVYFATEAEARQAGFRP